VIGNGCYCQWQELDGGVDHDIYSLHPELSDTVTILQRSPLSFPDQPRHTYLLRSQTSITTKTNIVDCSAAPSRALRPRHWPRRADPPPPSILPRWCRIHSGWPLHWWTWALLKDLLGSSMAMRWRWTLAPSPPHSARRRVDSPTSSSCPGQQGMLQVLLSLYFINWFLRCWLLVLLMRDAEDAEARTNTLITQIFICFTEFSEVIMSGNKSSNFGNQFRKPITEFQVCY
jgi:hypothetical protein